MELDVIQKPSPKVLDKKKMIELKPKSSNLEEPRSNPFSKYHKKLN
jgi:hypothetical protein